MIKHVPSDSWSCIKPANQPLSYWDSAAILVCIRRSACLSFCPFSAKSLHFSNLLLALTQVLLLTIDISFEGHISYNLKSLSKNESILSEECLYEIIEPLKYSQEPLTIMTVLLTAFGCCLCMLFFTTGLKCNFYGSRHDALSLMQGSNDVILQWCHLTALCVLKSRAPLNETNSSQHASVWELNEAIYLFKDIILQVFRDPVLY